MAAWKMEMYSSSPNSNNARSIDWQFDEIGLYLDGCSV